jgi:hypothetical protein
VKNTLRLGIEVKGERKNGRGRTAAAAALQLVTAAASHLDEQSVDVLLPEGRPPEQERPRLARPDHLTCGDSRRRAAPRGRTVRMAEEQDMAREAWELRRLRWTAGERLGFARGDD